MPDIMPVRMSDRMPDRMAEYLSEYMSGRMPDRMPDRMPEYMSDRMSEYIKGPDMSWWGSHEVKYFFCQRSFYFNHHYLEVTLATRGGHFQEEHPSQKGKKT